MAAPLASTPLASTPLASTPSPSSDRSEREQGGPSRPLAPLPPCPRAPAAEARWAAAQRSPAGDPRRPLACAAQWRSLAAAAARLRSVRGPGCLGPCVLGAWMGPGSASTRSGVSGCGCGCGCGGGGTSGGLPPPAPPFSTASRSRRPSGAVRRALTGRRRSRDARVICSSRPWGSCLPCWCTQPQPTFRTAQVPPGSGWPSRTPGRAWR